MLNRNSDVTLFVTFFDIAVGFGNLFPGIAPIDDGFQLARFNKLSEGDQVSACVDKDLQPYNKTYLPEETPRQTRSPRPERQPTMLPVLLRVSVSP